MPHISITPEPIAHILGLPITNSLITSWAVVALLSLGVYFFVYRKIKPVPGRVQNIAELAIEKLLDFMETVSGDREIARRYFPVVATIFLFVLSSNWIGILPGVGAVGFFESANGKENFVPLFRSVNSDINMTLALSLIVVTLSHIFGFIFTGVKGHLGKFLSFKSPIAFFTGALEIIGELSKILSLSFRLFGNVFAGEVLLAIVGFLIPYLAPVPFLGMEIFVGFIQALIFAVLAMVAFSSFSKTHA